MTVFRSRADRGDRAVEDVRAGAVEIGDGPGRAAVGVQHRHLGLDAVDHAVAIAILRDRNGLAVGAGRADGLAGEAAVAVECLAVDRGRTVRVVRDRRLDQIAVTVIGQHHVSRDAGACHRSWCRCSRP